MNKIRNLRNLQTYAFRRNQTWGTLSPLANTTFNPVSLRSESVCIVKQQLGYNFQFQSRSLSTSTNKYNAAEMVAEPFNVLKFMELNSDTSSASTGTIFSDTGPVLYTVDLLCALKDLDGLTWVQLILGTTIVVRLLTGLPVAIAQQRAVRRLEVITPEIKQIAEELKRETAFAVKKFGWDEKTAKRQFKKSFKKHWRKLMEEHNCHPMKSICLALTQIPIWICFSSALRNIVFGLPLPRTEEQGWRWFELFHEGTPWIDNLTVCDPYVLPVIFLSANLLNIFLHSRNNAKHPVPKNKLQKVMPWVFSGVVVGISGLACYVPSAVTLYWATSSCVALTQNIILMHPGLRKRLKMPSNSPVEVSSSATLKPSL